MPLRLKSAKCSRQIEGGPCLIIEKFDRAEAVAEIRPNPAPLRRDRQVSVLGIGQRFGLLPKPLELLLAFGPEWSADEPRNAAKVADGHS